VRFLNRPLGRLSRYRRGPVAGLLVVLLGLFLTGGLYAAFSPASSARADESAAQIKKGHELFLVGCSFCHGQNGQGIKTMDGNQLGPPLAGVGAAAVDFQVGTGRMPAVQPGPQIPQKEVSYTPDEIAALAAYVASLGPGPAIPNESDYNINDMTDSERAEAVVKGGEIFRTNCSACHNFEGAGGAMPQGGYAPKIRGVEPKYVFEAMLTGPQAMDNFSNGNLSVDEKRDIIAYLQSLQDSPEYGGFGMGGIGPVSEGMFAWLVGIGSLVAVAAWIAAHTARTSRQKADS
jgi:ubiquinol-cytochrome c reductase cytochrome c subunit